jgi:tRNA(adenine34) deaminase
MSLSLLLEPDRRWMKSALAEAQRALDAGEVPVGALVVREGLVVGRGRNMVEQLRDPTAHAEMIALTAACETLGQKYLTDCTLYVTLEPCPMCAGAIVWAKLKRVVFGAFDEKAGAAGTLYNLLQDPRLNHQTEILSGVEQDASAALLREFFQKKRAVR